MKKLLMVDDSEVNSNLMSHFLDNPNYEIATAKNGEQAVAACAANRFDLIIMDMNMPVLNGYEATQEIRKLVGYDKTPILAVTADNTKEDADKCLAAGCTAHFGKPILREVLTSAVVRYLGEGA